MDNKPPPVSDGNESVTLTVRVHYINVRVVPPEEVAELRKNNKAWVNPEPHEVKPE